MFNSPNPTRVRVPRNDCEIIIEKKGNKVIKKIRGQCSREQLKALSESSPDIKTEDF